jgi:16S rRNA (guanine527-N7)-methyltransferase
LSVTLIDASRKKVNFLKHIIRRLELENIGAVHVRAEELAEKPEFQVTFDVIISRAVSSMPDLIDLALPMLDKKGVIIAMKGSVSEAMLESNGLSIPKSSAIGNDNTPIKTELKRYVLPILEIERSIVIFSRTL